MKRILLISTLLLHSFQLFAGLIRVPYEGVRQVGMGNAFIALSDDANALWYNPAGLAWIRGVHFNLFDFTLGFDSQDSLNRLRNAVFKGDFNNLLRSDTEYLKFAVKPTFITPNFGISIFNNAQGFFDLRNMISDGIQAYAFNDLGILTGFSIPFGPHFAVGGSIKVFERTGLDLTITPDDLLRAAGTDIANFQSNIYNYLKGLAGTGYAGALNAGIIGRLPNSAKNGPQVSFAATAEDIGDTAFRKIGNAPIPPSIKHSYNFGVALKQPLSKDSVWNTALDLRNELQDMPFVKQFHFGTEIRLSNFGIRAGLYQGYGTFGLSIETPPHTRIHLATYGVELGNNGFERHQRWYVLQLVIGFNPI